MVSNALLVVSILFAGTPVTSAAAQGEPVKDFANAPSVLHITSEKYMTMLLVDGQPVQTCSSPKACTVMDLAPGNHEIDVRGGAFANKTLFKGIVKVTGGAEIWAKAHDNEFKVYNTQQLPVEQSTYVVAQHPAAATTQTTTVTTAASNDVPPLGGIKLDMSFVDPDTGEHVSMGVSAGATGSVASHSQTTTTTSTASSHPTGAVAVTGGPGTIEFTSEDGEGFTVFLDGKPVARYVGGPEGQSVFVRNVKPGEHKLVIKDFMGDDIWASGRLFMDPGFRLKMGVSEGRLEAFNRSSAFTPR